MKTTEIAPQGAARIHPRTARARAELITATVDILANEGFNALTMDRVAAVARSSKQTIYRLWSSKEDLVCEAVLDYVADHPDPDTGNVRDDLLALVNRQIHVLTSTKHGRALTAIWPYIMVSDEFRSRVLSPMRARRRGATVRIVARAIDRGELRADLDMEMLLDLLLSPAHLQIIHFYEVPDADYAERLVAPILAAYAPHDCCR